MNGQDHPPGETGGPQGQGVTPVPEPGNGNPAQAATAQQLEQTETRIEERMSGFERSMVRLTRAGVIVACITLVIFCGQLYEMWDAGQQTGKLVDYAKAQANASSDQADAAQQFSDTTEDINGGISDAVDQLTAAADNAKASIKATQYAMGQDQRAWLGAGDYTYTITESSPIESIAIVGNTGKSPAMNILCRITGTIILKGHTLTDSDIVYPPEMPIIKQGTIFPNQHFPLKAGGLPMQPKKQKIWFANVQSGEWSQYFFGDLRYKDTFGRDHWTHFCTQFVPATKSGTPCPIYNDTDDRKPN